MYKASANILIACSFLWLTACSSAGVVTEDLIPTDYVNPFIGASTSVGAAGVYHGLGKTFPGATTPYGIGQAAQRLFLFSCIREHHGRNEFRHQQCMPGV